MVAAPGPCVAVCENVSSTARVNSDYRAWVFGRFPLIGLSELDSIYRAFRVGFHLSGRYKTKIDSIYRTFRVRFHLSGRYKTKIDSIYRALSGRFHLSGGFPRWIPFIGQIKNEDSITMGAGAKIWSEYNERHNIIRVLARLLSDKVRKNIS